MEEKLILPGIVKMNEYYRKASVFALTSYHESFSLVAVEALACGLPVVSFELPCVKELFEGDATLIAPQGDINKFADNLRILFESREKLQEMSKEAIVASKKYSISKIAEKWKKLFEKLLSKD